MWGEVKRLKALTVFILVFLVLLFLIALVFAAQYFSERDAFIVPPITGSYGDAKLAAEIRQIQSDTSGSLFWLKFFGFLFTVTVAVSGYLFGQSEATKKRIEAEDERTEKSLSFEHRKNIDIAYQEIVQELSDEKPILRAAAAVKLGSILQSFPAEWQVSNERKKQLVQLTKQILAAALSIEENDKVLKTITIALILDKPLEKKVKGKTIMFADVKQLDLSSAKAKDAYWAKSDFTRADFFRADLSKTSFRSSTLIGAQFREAVLTEAVLTDADCENANFEGAKVWGMNLDGANLKGIDMSVMVDNSRNGDGSGKIQFNEWINSK